VLKGRSEGKGDEKEQIRSDTIEFSSSGRSNVGHPIISLPFGDGLHQPFMGLGMAYCWVYYIKRV